MAEMMQFEAIIVEIEKYVKQLEGLAYSKNAGLAVRLQGAIDASIRIAGVSSDTWNRRVQAALLDVMREKVETPPVTTEGLPPSILNNVVIPTASSPAKSNQVLPTI